MSSFHARSRLPCVGVHSRVRRRRRRRPLFERPSSFLLVFPIDRFVLALPSSLPCLVPVHERQLRSPYLALSRSRLDSRHHQGLGPTTDARCPVLSFPPRQMGLRFRPSSRLGCSHPGWSLYCHRYALSASLRLFLPYFQLTRPSSPSFSRFPDRAKRGVPVRSQGRLLLSNVVSIPRVLYGRTLSRPRPISSFLC
jgi:hypothetical protein